MIWPACGIGPTLFGFRTRDYAQLNECYAAPCLERGSVSLCHPICSAYKTLRTRGRFGGIDFSLCFWVGIPFCGKS